MGSTSGPYINDRNREEKKQGGIVLKRPQSLPNRVSGGPGSDGCAYRLIGSQFGFSNRRRV